MTNEKLERILNMEPAFDKRDPDPHKNYGIHGVTLRMVVKGEKGAVQFVLYTNWMLPHVQDELDLRPGSKLLSRPLPVDIGYHARSPRYAGQGAMPNCQYLDGAPCYYDGSGLRAEEVYQVLLSAGSDGVWKYLEEEYDSLFGQE